MKLNPFLKLWNKADERKKFNLKFYCNAILIFHTHTHTATIKKKLEEIPIKCKFFPFLKYDNNLKNEIQFSIY